MGITIEGNLDGNSVAIDEDFQNSTQQGRIVLNGSGIRISIRTSRGGSYFSADLDSGCSLDLAPNSYVNVLDVHLRNRSAASIGDNTFAIGKLKLYSHETGIIRIGSNCLIGGEVVCMTSDMHSVVEVASQERINPPGDVHIGDKVWLGPESVILKGTTIGQGSIVAIRSVVMGKMPPNAMIVGYPARVVRNGVTWAVDLLPMPG